MEFLARLVPVLAQTDLDQPTTVVITFNPEQVITWTIIGILAGFLASVLVRGRRAGLVSSLVVGLLGALVGGFLFSLLGISVDPALTQGITLRFIDIIVAFVGAIIVLAVMVLLFGRRAVR